MFTKIIDLKSSLVKNLIENFRFVRIVTRRPLKIRPRQIQKLSWKDQVQTHGGK